MLGTRCWIQAKQLFAQNGVLVTAWAQTIVVSVALVYTVISNNRQEESRQEEPRRVAFEILSSSIGHSYEVYIRRIFSEGPDRESIELARRATGPAGISLSEVQLLERALSNRELRSDLHAIIRHFDVLLRCVERRVCETLTLLAARQEDAKQIADIYSEYIRQRQRTDKSFAEALLRFARGDLQNVQ